MTDIYYCPPATDHTIYCHGTIPLDCEKDSCQWTTYTNKVGIKYRFWSKEASPPQSPCVNNPTLWKLDQPWTLGGLQPDQSL